MKNSGFKTIAFLIATGAVFELQLFYLGGAMVICCIGLIATFMTDGV